MAIVVVIDSGCHSELINSAMKRFGIYLLLFLCNITSFIQASSCPLPAVPINAGVTVGGTSAGDLATYSCDAGYTLFGSATSTCGGDGKWSGELPVCATNVAYMKPVNQSSTSRGGKPENGNDGDASTIDDDSRCTQTLSESSPWWSVDLLQGYMVQVVRITTRGCCDQQPLQNIEVRVGDSTNIQLNRLCAWYPGTIEEGSRKELKCAVPITGRYVFIQLVGTEGVLSFCELEVFSTEEFSRERCTDKSQITTLRIFNQTCYEMQMSEGGDWDRGREYCQERGGDLIHSATAATHTFVTSELKRRAGDMKANFVWIGAQKEPQFVSRTWRWVDETEVKEPLWGRDQPNNYNGKQNCVALDGARDWKWNDVGCDLNYLHWICQFKPSRCGSPDAKQNTTIIGRSRNTGTSIKYSCPVGHRVLGDMNRTCLESGVWSGKPPVCKYVDCGAPSTIEHGSVVLTDTRTTHAARALYECGANYTLDGSGELTCGDNGKWSPEVPRCLYSWCDDLGTLANGHIETSGRKAGDTAEFICDPGHYLHGTKNMTCQLGGRWSGSVPECRFVDCGQPHKLQFGEMTLVNGTTHLGSLVVYECGGDYWLNGPMERRCLDDAHWSDDAPECVLTSCGEPSVPEGGYVTGYSFEVHSEVAYHCHPGHYMEGDSIRLCTRDGTWSGHPPVCVYVDCGRVPTLPRGQVSYLNESTHLHSVLQISCGSGYRLEGVAIRKCGLDGQWNGETARCEEIRCSEPEPPELGKVVVTGSDRRTISTIARRREHVVLDNSYRVGSQAMYRCNRGHVVDGLGARMCLANGTWSGKSPVCMYVDCGLPESINPGSFRLLSNTTSYGSQVSYGCGENWKLEGKLRRHCLENGTWSGETPKCNEVLCTELLSSVSNYLSVDQGDLRVGTVARYSCALGRQLVGEAERECKTHGIWSGFQPRCEIVSCNLPEEIPNGRVVRLNESLVYGTVVEYHCLPKFTLQGSFHRVCQANARWSDDLPVCEVDDGGSRGILVDNTVDGTSNEARGGSLGGVDGSDSGYTGLWAGLAVGLVGIFVVAAVCLLMRVRQRKNEADVRGASVGADKAPRDPSMSEIMSYSNLSDPTTGNNIYENIAEEGDYTDMSTENTYSTPDNTYTHPDNDNTYYNNFNNNNNNGDGPTYTNATVNRPTGNANNMMRRPRLPPPQPPTAPPSMVTINGVTVASNGT